MRLETIFCDLVRIENSGKHLLVGVYASDSMFVPVIPGGLTISAFTRISEIPKGYYDIQTRFFSSADPDNPLATFNTSINVIYPDFPTPIVSGPANIFLIDPSFVLLKVKVTGSNGQYTEMSAGHIFVGRSRDK